MAPMEMLPIAFLDNEISIRWFKPVILNCFRGVVLGQLEVWFTDRRGNVKHL